MNSPYEQKAREIADQIENLIAAYAYPARRQAIEVAIAAALSEAVEAEKERCARDPTDYKAEFERIRGEYHKLSDFWSAAVTDAERIVRPYLHTGAVFGVTPDHRFNENLASIPFNLTGDIAKAIAAIRSTQTETGNE